MKTSPHSNFGPWRFAGLAGVYASAVLCTSILIAAYAISHFTKGRQTNIDPLPKFHWEEVR